MPSRLGVRLRRSARNWSPRPWPGPGSSTCCASAWTEIARIDPQPGEDVALAAEARRLQAVDDLRLAVRTAVVALAGDEETYDRRDEALNLVGSARKALSPVVDADPSLAPMVEQLADAAAVLADVASGLSSYLAGLDADPVRLEWIAGPTFRTRAPHPQVRNDGGGGPGLRRGVGPARGSNSTPATTASPNSPD